MAEEPREEKKGEEKGTHICSEYSCRFYLNNAHVRLEERQFGSSEQAYEPVHFGLTKMLVASACSCKSRLGLSTLQQPGTRVSLLDPLSRQNSKGTTK